MTERISMIVLLGTLALASGCSSGHDAAGTGGTGGTGGSGGTGGTVDAALTEMVQPPCGSGQNTSCLPSGFPFVRFAFAHSNACNGICPAVSPAGPWTIVLSQPQAGTLCLSGTNPDPTGTGLTLDFTKLAQPDPSTLMVLERFNADVLHIKQVRFTVDSPPSGGISVSADTLHSDICHGVDCITFGFALPDRVAATGTVTAALVDFVSDPPQTFDTRALDAIGFDVGPGDFNFCVHDFQFLDANGAAVTPTP
jgi:hypothetical protein